MRVVDLTQPLGPRTPVWPGSPAPAVEPLHTYERDGGLAYVVSLGEHTGTHVDAPAHFVAGAETVDRIAVERLVVELAVVDVRDRTARHPDYCVSVADLERDEARNGPIEVGSAVAICTGWGARSADEESYFGTDGDGVLHFPGLGREAAEWLVHERRIVGVGIDTAGIDPGCDTTFEVHAAVTLPRGVWHLEGLVNLESVPARGATVVVGVIPFVAGSGAPARVLALVPAAD